MIADQRSKVRVRRANAIAGPLSAGIIAGCLGATIWDFLVWWILYLLVGLVVIVVLGLRDATRGSA